MAWDATCTDSFSASNLCSTILKPGSASSAAEDLKRRKYSQLVADFEFVAVETSGIIGSAGCSLLTDIGRRISRALMIPARCLTSFNRFQLHHPRQLTGNNSLIKEICPGVGCETLTFLSWSVIIKQCGCLLSSKFILKSPHKNTIRFLLLTHSQLNYQVIAL